MIICLDFWVDSGPNPAWSLPADQAGALSGSMLLPMSVRNEAVCDEIVTECLNGVFKMMNVPHLLRLKRYQARGFLPVFRGSAQSLQIDTLQTQMSAAQCCGGSECAV